MAATGAAAQTRAAPPAEPGDTEVEEVVVTGGPFAVSLSSVTTHVDVVNQQQLDTAPLGGLGDVLSEVPGVRSSFYGPGSSRPVIRGLSGARVLVLQNGVGMVDASTLSPDHAVASDPAEATRIEVLRGPSALAYGGSGVGGVVNVIDERIPTSRPDDALEGRVSASVQSGDDARALSGHVKTGKRPWVVTATGSVRRSDDYHVPAPPVSERYAAAHDVTPLEDDVVRNSSVDLEAYGAGVSYVKENGAYLGMGINRTESRYGIPFAQIAEPPAPDDEGPVQIHLHQTRYDLRGETPLDWSWFEKARFSLGYADYKHAEQLVDTGETGTTFISHGAEGRFEVVHREHEGHQGAVGVQGVHRTFSAIGDEAFVPPTDITDGGIFTLQRLDRGRWGVDAGLRLDYAKLDSTVGERDFTNVSGSAGVFYRPSEPLFLALSGSYTGRAPTEFELFANGPHPGTGGFELGDPALESERVLNAEGTVRYTAGPLKLEGHLYYAHYAGYIDERGTNAFEDGLRVFRFIQTDADFVGFEGEASYRLWEDGDRNLTAEADYDVVRASTPVGTPARIPPYAVTGRLIYATARTRTELEVRHLGGQDRVTPFELPTDAYTMVNASFEARPFRDESIKLFADGRNLNDVEAREHTSFLKDIAPLPGREVRLGLAYDF
ncbi:MAG TPA: TonB-dependent receptor [Caulobacteraceae bacterium]